MAAVHTALVPRQLDHDQCHSAGRVFEQRNAILLVVSFQEFEEPGAACAARHASPPRSAAAQLSLASVVVQRGVFADAAHVRAAQQSALKVRCRPGEGGVVCRGSTAACARRHPFQRSAHNCRSHPSPRSPPFRLAHLKRHMEGGWEESREMRARKAGRRGGPGGPPLQQSCAGGPLTCPHTARRSRC